MLYKSNLCMSVLPSKCFKIFGNKINHQIRLQPLEFFADNSQRPRRFGLGTRKRQVRNRVGQIFEKVFCNGNGKILHEAGY